MLSRGASRCDYNLPNCIVRRSLRGKKRLQKRFLFLNNLTRVAAGNSHYLLLELENLAIFFLLISQKNFCYTVLKNKKIELHISETLNFKKNE
jgi:hypothetical protein